MELFETFCLPSIVHQTIQSTSRQADHPQKLGQGGHPQASVQADPPQAYRFLWIVKVDPNLDPVLRNRLIELLQPYPNFFLVGSNNNFGASYGTGIEPGSWRGGHAGHDVLYNNVTTNITDAANRSNGTHIYTGDVSLLHVAHAHRADKIVLETRLDADDGLPLHYLEEIQDSATEHLSDDPMEAYEWPPSSLNVDTNDRESEEYEEEEEEEDSPRDHSHKGKARWMYWCVPHSISWHPTVLENGFDPHISLEPDDPGRLILDTNKGNLICMTPGLTSGMSVGIDDSEVPRYSHYELLKQLKRIKFKPENNCGVQKSSKPCLQVLDEETVRSRTPTSAGMKNVGIKELEYTKEEIETQWKYMLDKFGVRRDRAVIANRHIHTNLVRILEDNLMGQCSHGHSCKDAARMKLMSMIEAAKARDDPDKKKWAAMLLKHG